MQLSTEWSALSVIIEVFSRYTIWYVELTSLEYTIISRDKQN